MIEINSEYRYFCCSSVLVTGSEREVSYDSIRGKNTGTVRKGLENMRCQGYLVVQLIYVLYSACSFLFPLSLGIISTVWFPSQGHHFVSLTPNFPSKMHFFITE